MREIPTKHLERIEHVRSKLISPQELRDLCEGDELLEALMEDVSDYSIRYAQDVWEMDELIKRYKDGELSKEEWKEEMSNADADRTRLHNALIDSVAILPRNMRKKEVDNSWIKGFTDGTGSLARASCGTFAFMVLFDSLSKEQNHE